MTRIWKNILRLLTRSEEGSVIPLVALGMFVLVGATGTAIDMGRQEIVQSRLQNAWIALAWRQVPRPAAPTSPPW